MFHMLFYSYWHPKQLVVTIPNAGLTPFTTIIIHFTCTMVWVKGDSFWQHGFFFFFQSFADCRHPVGIISSINTTQRHSVHSSLKESTGISLVRSVWEMMKRRSEDSFYIYIYIIISALLCKVWNTSIMTHSQHSRKIAEFSVKWNTVQSVDL